MDKVVIPADIKIPLSKIPDSIKHLVEKENTWQEPWHYLVHPLIGGLYTGDESVAEWRGRINVTDGMSVVAFW